MKTRRWLRMILLACAAALASPHQAHAICGIPNIYGVSIPAAPVGFVVLFSPILAPIPPFFPPTGIASVPLGAPFGDAARETILAAGTSVPPKFMSVLGGPGQCSLCVVAPPAIIFSICVAPTFVGVFN